MTVDFNKNIDESPNQGECRSISVMLSDYLETTLSGRQVWLVEKHLAACQECTALMRQLQSTVDLLHSVEHYDTSNDFMAKLHARLDLLEPERQRSRSPFSVVRDWVEGVRQSMRPRRTPVLFTGMAAVVFGLMIVSNTTTKDPNIGSEFRPAPEALSRHVALAAGNPFDDPVAAKVEADTDPSADTRTDSSSTNPF